MGEGGGGWREACGLVQETKCRNWVLPVQAQSESQLSVSPLPNEDEASSSWFQMTEMDDLSFSGALLAPSNLEVWFPPLPIPPKQIQYGG